MSYSIYAKMVKGQKSQEFELTMNRADNDRLFEEIRKVYPDALVENPGDVYPTVTLTPDKAVVLFEAWHKDLIVVTEADFDEDARPVDPSLFCSWMDSDYPHVLLDRVELMLDFARFGYEAIFSAE